MFYEKFVRICDKRGVAKGAAAEAVGMNRSAATDWKKGSIPKPSTVAKLCAYFGVPDDFFNDDVDYDCEYGTVVFRRRLEQELVNIDEADAEAVGFSIDRAASMVSGETQITLDDACVIADELGHSLDYMVGLKDEEPADNGKLRRFIELFTALPEERQVQAEDFLRYLATIPIEK